MFKQIQTSTVKVFEKLYRKQFRLHRTRTETPKCILVVFSPAAPEKCYTPQYENVGQIFLRQDQNTWYQPDNVMIQQARCIESKSEHNWCNIWDRPSHGNNMILFYQTEIDTDSVDSFLKTVQSYSSNFISLLGEIRKAEVL